VRTVGLHLIGTGVGQDEALGRDGGALAAEDTGAGDQACMRFCDVRLVAEVRAK
jgi:hypothetical protein